YENIANTNDSILKLVNLPEADRLAYFETFVERLKVQAEEEKLKLEAIEVNNGLVTVNNNQGNVTPTRVGSTPNAAPSFYFYNPTAGADGKNEFIKICGNRSLDDDWRCSTKNTSNTNSVVLDSYITISATEEEKFDPEFHISKIP